MMDHTRAMRPAPKSANDSRSISEITGATAPMERFASKSTNCGA